MSRDQKQQQQPMELDVSETLQQLRSSAPAPLQSYFATFQDLHERKLWHQLTVQLMEFSRQPTSGPFLIRLYEGFLQPWESKMNPSSFVQLMLATAKQYQDPKSAIAFLDTIVGKMEEHKDAQVLAKMEAAHYRLLLQDLEGTKAAMEECETTLDQLQGVDSIVHASFYRVSADYNKAKAEYNQFYKNALLFLACMNVEEMPTGERVERAYDLAIAALLGDGIYNFGELLMHPILQALQANPQHGWLAQLLLAFNAGDIGKFDVLGTHFSKMPLLAQGVPFLRQKLCLMALMELVFKRVGVDRRISFSVVGQETRLPADEIEHLIMKALALQLIRGQIDQVEQVVVVDWVQPRVLGKPQIEGMKLRLAGWKSKVQELASVMEQQTPELFAQ